MFTSTFDLWGLQGDFLQDAVDRTTGIQDFLLEKVDFKKMVKTPFGTNVFF